MGSHIHALCADTVLTAYPQTMVLVLEDSENCLHVSGPPLMLLFQMLDPPCLPEACLLSRTPAKCHLLPNGLAPLPSLSTPVKCHSF